MSRTAILSVRVVSDTKQAQRGAQETASAWEKFEKRLDQASIVAGGVSVGLFKLGSDAYKAAGQLEQSGGAVETVFGKYQKSITDFAQTSWESVGLSQNKTQEMATILGSQLKNLGTPMEEVGGQTLDLIKLGSDLAATYGGDTSQAVEALSSLLRGERDPIERYGVTINQAMLNAEKAALGLDGLTGAADRNADMQATMSLLTKQTADATGQFAREANTAEGAAQRNAARWETVQAQLGQKLLPIMIEVSTALTGLAGWVSENSDLVLVLAGVLGGASAAILGLNAGIKTVRAVAPAFTLAAKAGSGAAKQIGSFVSGMRDSRAAASSFSGVAGTMGGKVAQFAKMIGKGAVATGRWVVQTTILTAKLVAQRVAQMAIAVASKAAAAAQWLWNAASNANPLILIITLIVAAIVLLILNWDKVKAVATTVWEAISTAAQWFWQNVLLPIGQWIVSTFVNNWNRLKAGAEFAWLAMKTGGMILWNLIKSIGTWIASTFVNGWNRVKAGAQFAWNAMKAGGQIVLGAIRNVVSWVRDRLAGAWQFMQSAGQNALNAIMWPIDNLVSGLQTAWSWVRKVWDKVSGGLGGIFGFSAGPQTAPAGLQATAAPMLPGVLLAGAAASGGGGSTTVNITMSMPNYVGDRHELIRWIKEALRSDTRDIERIIYA